MNAFIWNLISKKNMSPKAKARLFLISVSFLYGLIGFLLWLLIGNKLFEGSKSWMLCFIGLPIVFPGFLTGIFYLYNHEEI